MIVQQIRVGVFWAGKKKKKSRKDWLSMFFNSPDWLKAVCKAAAVL
jgi:hypothetical protein